MQELHRQVSVQTGATKTGLIPVVSHCNTVFGCVGVAVLRAGWGGGDDAAEVVDKPRGLTTLACSGQLPWKYMTHRASASMSVARILSAGVQLDVTVEHAGRCSSTRAGASSPRWKAPWQLGDPAWRGLGAS